MGGSCRTVTKSALWGLSWHAAGPVNAKVKNRKPKKAFFFTRDYVPSWAAFFDNCSTRMLTTMERSTEAPKK